MAVKIIAATVSVDTGNSVTNLAAVTNEANKVDKALANTGKSATDTGKSVVASGGNFGKLKETIGSLPGPLGSAGQGVAGLSTAFKALLANPIGLILLAIVTILTTLYKAFTNTFEGANKVEEVFAGIGAAGQALLDNLGKIASAIKNVFTFNFAGAKKDIEEVANAAKNAYNTMAKLTAEAQKLDREQAKNDYDAIDRKAKIADLKEKLGDDEVSAKEKIRIGKELLVASEQNAKEDLKLAKDRSENAIAQLTIQKEGEEKNLKEILKIRGEQKQSEIDSSNEIRSVRKLITRAEKQDAAELAAIAKEAAEARKEANEKYKAHLKEQKELAEKQAKQQEDLRKAQREARIDEIKDIEDYGKQLATEQNRIDKAEIDRINNNEKMRLETKKKLAELDILNNPENPEAKIALVDATLQLELSKLADGDLQKQILARKASNDIIKIKADEVAAKAALDKVEEESNQAKISAISGAIGTLASIAGKQTVLGKAFAIVQTTIDTYQSAIAAYKSVAGIPVIGPALGAIAAAGAIATGIATVKKIVAVQVPGGGGGGGAVPSGIPVSAPLTPQTTGTRLDSNSLNNLGSAVQPVQAYVVESQGADSAERISRLNRAARLGG